MSAGPVTPDADGGGCGIVGMFEMDLFAEVKTDQTSVLDLLAVPGVVHKVHERLALCLRKGTRIWTIAAPD